ncbi:V-set domain-containing T-cell activation inhibitor 1-like isoform X2 [Paralichthys olivaceus]|uniref:V-set domain-containing T-cell activation inhibitor 1-like isoform X2 n=1 Tax=Paralichthys olivaceus TaxID=8255 RepID=UPI0037519B9C
MDVFELTCVIVSVFMCDQVGSVLSDRQVSDFVKVFVTEGDDVILPCAPNPKVNIEGTVFDWKKDDKEVFLFSDGGYYGNGLSGQDKDFKGRVSHFVEELKHGNASILIKNTKTTDSGSYSCFFPHLKPSQIFRIELVVGAAPPPSVKILNATGDGVLLQCSVRGAFPKPQVEWQTSDGKIVPAEEPQVSQRGDLYDVVLLATVNKMKTVYRCVVKQDGFGHVIDDELFVPDILLEDKSCYSTSVDPFLITIIITLLVVICVETLIIIRNRRKVLRDKAAGATKAETSELNGDEETGAREETIELNGHQQKEAPGLKRRHLCELCNNEI